MTGGGIGSPQRRSAYAAALLLVLLFVASRTALLVTSYDANQNWEEPVFLFSATELQRVGLAQIFDYQDDLNHGGSVVLILLAVPWVQMTGTSLVALKGLAIVWSTLTLCAFMAVGWRYWSARAALLTGVFFVALSPIAARINVTLVGSHPEALLPCAVAWGVYWEWLTRRDTQHEDGVALAVLLGWTSGVALWMAYMSAMFVAPGLVIRLCTSRRWQSVAALSAGLLLGLAPWAYQDLWLRPHGALLWTEHLLAGHRNEPAGQGWVGTLSQLAASFGYPGDWGVLLLAACAIAWAALALSMRGTRMLVLAPLVCTPLLGLVMLANSYHPLADVEGYYHYRFFIPLQAALLCGLAVAIDGLATRCGGVVALAAALIALGAGGAAQAPLYGRGNHYEANFPQDRGRGCHVYGAAEWERSPSAAVGIRRLAAIGDQGCRVRAFGGLGWGLGGQFLRDGDVGLAIATLDEVPDRALRWSMCSGFLFVVPRAPEAQVSAAQRTAATREVYTYCQGFRPS